MSKSEQEGQTLQDQVRSAVGSINRLLMIVMVAAGLLVVSLVSVVVVFVNITDDMHEQRRANCEQIVAAFDAQTDTLIASSRRGTSRTPEELESFDARADAYRAELEALLPDCK